MTWATPTTTVVDEETPPMSTSTLPRPIETKAILKGSTLNVNSASTTSLCQDAAGQKPNAEAAPVKKPDPEQVLSVELHNSQHSPVGQRMSSGSSGYSATDEVDYLKWISESATRPRQGQGFGEKRTESDSSGCSPDGVESPDTIREEVTPSPQRSSSPDSGYEHGNGNDWIFYFLWMYKLTKTSILSALPTMWLEWNLLYKIVEVRCLLEWIKLTLVISVKL